MTIRSSSIAEPADKKRTEFQIKRVILMVQKYSCEGRCEIIAVFSLTEIINILLRFPPLQYITQG